MLDVLDAHAIGTPDEHCAGVGSVDDVVDHAHVLGLGNVLVDGVDQHGEVVQQRLLGIAGLAGVEFDVRAADLDARMAGRRRRRGIEAEPLVCLGRLGGLRRVEGDVVEVVLRVRRRLDELQPDALAEVNLPRDACRQRRDAESHMLERSLLARSFRAEQGQLAPACIRADEREVVLPVDDVHTEPAGEGLGDRLAVGEPEGDVVERLRVHAETLATTAGSTTRCYFLASTARCSCCLFIWERPGTFRRFASL